jgi:hypothetical protein
MGSCVHRPSQLGGDAYSCKILCYVFYCYVWGICVTNNNGLWIGWLDLLPHLKSQSITTAHSQCLSKTCSIPYWTTSVFSSIVTDFFSFDCLEWRLPYEWIIELPYECRMIELSWTELTSRRSEYTSLPRTVHVILFFRCHEARLPNRWPAMDWLFRVYSLQWERAFGE